MIPLVLRSNNGEDEESRVQLGDVTRDPLHPSLLFFAGNLIGVVFGCLRIYLACTNFLLSKIHPNSLNPIISVEIIIIHALILLLNSVPQEFLNGCDPYLMGSAEFLSSKKPRRMDRALKSKITHILPPKKHEASMHYHSK